MSLSEAVLGIVESMEADVKSHCTGKGVEILKILKGYINQLRIALKASEGSSPSAPPAYTSPEVQHRDMIEKAKAEFRKVKDRFAAEEMVGERMVEVVDGPESGTFIMVPVVVPVNSKTIVNGHIYQMGEDGKAHHVDESRLSIDPK